MDTEEKDFLLEKVMVQYGDELVRLAFSYVKDAETAKDMVQNTFIKCYSHLDTFRFDAHIKTWLYRMTINECKDYLKSWNYRMVQVSSLISETTKAIIPSTEKTVIDNYTNAEIKDTVFTLPKAYREVVYLYYYDSLKPREIADILEIPLNTVKTRLRRGKEKLKSTMEEAELNGR
ncbi:sigma-70 family RNA polymerase sigma factor [Planomicrobium sp. YIM 101495]|uniref:sigma-70 family RNA polymerase sigma factor n=1 Tax=Planomicrobium sp. YIM 101495 TaxID=2665160 RepID=UPI0012B89216|nr:sigma-70 family RNA polymerase sigma factor [Planomicrobium sp. YIM 101495]MTD31872.1 sigma-70 family RNA polymerase sigma factor [Planomicrobium sp. YIM 101495]